MAQKVVVELIDDLDGTPIPAGKGESIDFAVDGVTYTIDLGPKNAKAFRKTFDTYLAHATRTGGRRQRRTHTHTAVPAATRRKRVPSGNGPSPTDTRSPPAAASPSTSNRPTTTRPDTTPRPNASCTTATPPVPRRFPRMLVR